MDLRGHALVDAIQQFFDEPCAGFRGEQGQRRASLKLALRGSKPPPAVLAIAEYLLAQRDDARDPHDAIRLVPVQCFPSSSSMGQRPARDHEGIDFFVSQPAFSQGIDHPEGQALLDESDEILIRAKAPYAKDLLEALEDAGMVNLAGVEDGFCHGPSLRGIVAHQCMASCPSVSKHSRKLLL